MGRLFPAKYFTSILHSKMENPKRKLIAHVKPTIYVFNTTIFFASLPLNKEMNSVLVILNILLDQFNFNQESYPI